VSRKGGDVHWKTKRFLGIGVLVVGIFVFQGLVELVMAVAGVLIIASATRSRND
jgi:hypothetical protein